MTSHRLVTYVVTSSHSDGTKYMHSTHTIRLFFTTYIVDFTSTSLICWRAVMMSWVCSVDGGNQKIFQKLGHKRPVKHLLRRS